ncbi:unnamed protein product, partial [Meganyctiphanes norvegica]
SSMWLWWWWSWWIAALVTGSSSNSISSVSPYGLLGPQGVVLPPKDFVHRAQLDQYGAYVMLWTPREEDIIIEVQVSTRGYVGLGWSPHGGMKNADIALAWVNDDDGKVHLNDRHASGERTPAIDASQDLRLIGGYQNNTHTVIRWARPWTTCDDQQDFQLTGDTVRVIWAYDEEDPSGDGEGALPRHAHRGTRSLYLREPRPTTALLRGANVVNWDIRSPKVALPGDMHTLYWCKLYKIPDIDRKHHVIGYEPIIDVSNIQYVHHMILYECHLKDSHLHLEKFAQAKGSQCYGGNMPPSWYACNTPLIAWAVGSEGESYPSQAGFPLGEDFGGATYFMLEIHYNNPNYRKGVVDSSGLRIFHTDQLREHDAAVMTMGHSVVPAHIIPPGRKWTTVGHCTADCTEKGLPEEGVKVFSAVLHAHLLGSSIGVRQIRNGREMPQIIKDSTYDFNYQQTRVLEDQLTILPGDFLVTECTYDASRRTHPTFGGFASTEEMCLVFLAYYPRANLSECFSYPDISMLLDTFGIQKVYNNDKIIGMFQDTGFSDDYINSEWEEKLLKQMDQSVTVNATDISLSAFHTKVIVVEPKDMYNQSFYSILQNTETWQDEQLLQNLQMNIMEGPHVPTCQFHGRLEVDGLAQRTRYPNYIALKSLQQDCISPSDSIEAVQSPESEAYTTPSPTRTLSPTPGSPESPVNEVNENKDFAELNEVPKTPTPTLPPHLQNKPLEENKIDTESLAHTQRGGSQNVQMPTTMIIVYTWLFILFFY